MCAAAIAAGAGKPAGDKFTAPQDGFRSVDTNQ
ncbi:hypothetical protein [Vogesella margarita]